MVVLFFQSVACIFSIALFKIFTRFEVYGKENLQTLSKPYIVVSNHESHLDPQLVGGVIFLYRPKLLPFFYITKDSFFKIPVFNWIIRSLGAFPAHKKEGIEKSLEIPTNLLKAGQGIVMFPEGRIIPERPALGEGRRGAAMLALTTGAELLPISLHTPAQLGILQFLFGRKRIVIRIGEPFRLNKNNYPTLEEKDTYAATAEIMAKIATLYNQHHY